MRSSQKNFVQLITTSLLLTISSSGADQSVTGTGNSNAVALATKSPIVQSAMEFLTKNARRIQGPDIRNATLDAISNADTCVSQRAGVLEDQKRSILEALLNAGLIDLGDDKMFPGGLKAGVFPALIDDGGACPKLPQTFFSAPRSSFSAHHSYPGGLAIHEAFNNISFENLASGYRRVYGHTRADGLPILSLEASTAEASKGDFLNDDIVIAAPIWHDWAKTMVFQWSSDGSEFQELNFGGNSKTDNYGSTGDSKTGEHDIISATEAMVRGLPPDLVIAQVSAHSAPTLGNEYKVVNWLRAAAILAQIDPVDQAYLMKDDQGRLRLPALRHLGDISLVQASTAQTNLLAEYPLHNLSDADFNFTNPPLAEIQVILQAVAPRFGFDSANTGTYNNVFRNPVLSYLTVERLLMIYGNKGLDGVAAEVSKLRKAGII